MAVCAAVTAGKPPETTAPTLAKATVQVPAPAPGRRSSAAQELHLTKCYFYQHLQDSGLDNERSGRDDNDDEERSVEKLQANCVSDHKAAGASCCAKFAAVQTQTPAAAADSSRVALDWREQVVADWTTNGDAETMMMIMLMEERASVAAAAAAAAALPASGCNTTSGANQRLQQPTGSVAGSASDDADEPVNLIKPTSDRPLSESSANNYHYSNKTAEQQAAGYTHGASRCSTQISSSATTTNSCAYSLHDQHNQQQLSDQYYKHLAKLHYLSPTSTLRRNSSPASLRQQPSIEEQLKRLLDIKPALAGDHEASVPTHSETTMKKSGPSGQFGSSSPGKTSLSSSSSSSAGAAKQGGANTGESNKYQNQFKQQERSQQQSSSRHGSSGISPEDRLMIFMLASRRSSSNSAVERNARILKWMHNCKNAS